MFDITSNQVIKIHKGDDSGTFVLFINQGTKYEPIQFKLYPKVSVTQSPEQLDIDIDTDTFSSKISNDGFYDFEYNYLYDESGAKIGELGWYLNQQLVNMTEYGITIEGTPEIADHIVIAQFIKNVSEIYFYLLETHADIDNYIMKKTFITNGTTYTEYGDCRLYTIENSMETVDSNGNAVLEINNEDTQYLMSGEYCYQIKAKLYDIDNEKYVLNTITNRLPFYLVDGIDSVIW